MAEVIGAIRNKWLAFGGDGGQLGKALDVERPTFDGVGRAQEFEGGTISWHPTTGAFATVGLIRARWLELGREQFGYPITDESGCPDGRGRFNHYRQVHLPGNPETSIYWTPETGAHEVFGAIRAKWAALGWERFFGYPTTGELGCPDGRGRFNHFERGSIYWTAETGAHEVHGAIRDNWASMGWERGWLGYPISDEVDFPEGGRANSFEHGGIYWWPDTGPIALGDVVVRYRGLNCFGETDELSGSDEPFVIVGVLAPDGQRPTFRTRVFDDVDGGESLPDPGAEVYRGRPFSVDLSVTIMEHDEGDPNAHRDLVHQGVKVAADQAKPALQSALVSTGWLAPLAVAVGPVLDAMVPVIVDAINDLLGSGDDVVGTVPLRLTAKELCVLTAAAHQAERAVRFHIASSLVTDGEASYKAYFDVVRA